MTARSLPPVRSRRGLYRTRVPYADTDRAQIVHHAAYFRYLEMARVEMWREGGLDYAAYELRTGLGFPVVEAHLRYRVAARFDDLIEVETWVSRATRASVYFDAVIRRGEHVLNEAMVRVACVRLADGALRKIPDELLDASLDVGHGV
jgi:acyl-CoA thioester hydrolase